MRCKVRIPMHGDAEHRDGGEERVLGPKMVKYREGSGKYKLRCSATWEY